MLYYNRKNVPLAKQKQRFFRRFQRQKPIGG